MLRAATSDNIQLSEPTPSPPHRSFAPILTASTPKSASLEVILKSGARKTVRVEYHRGHFKNPMTDAEMEEKFRLMAQNTCTPIASTICFASSGGSRASRR
jgi:2-methylcitrate dehydratase PrpD